MPTCRTDYCKCFSDPDEFPEILKKGYWICAKGHRNELKGAYDNHNDWDCDCGAKSTRSIHVYWCSVTKRRGFG